MEGSNEYYHDNKAYSTQSHDTLTSHIGSNGNQTLEGHNTGSIDIDLNLNLLSLANPNFEGSHQGSKPTRATFTCGQLGKRRIRKRRTCPIMGNECPYMDPKGFRNYAEIKYTCIILCLVNFLCSILSSV